MSIEHKRLSRMTQEEIDACIEAKNFVGVKFDSARKLGQIKELIGIKFDFCDFINTTIEKRDFSWCEFDSCRFDEVDIDYCEFFETNFLECHFTHCNITWTKFDNVCFKEVRFKENRFISPTFHAVAFSIDEATNAECDMISAYLAFEVAMVKVGNQYFDWYGKEKGIVL